MSQCKAINHKGAKKLISEWYGLALKSCSDNIPGILDVKTACGDVIGLDGEKLNVISCENPSTFKSVVFGLERNRHSNAFLRPTHNFYDSCIPLYQYSSKFLHTVGSSFDEVANWICGPINFRVKNCLEVKSRRELYSLRYLGALVSYKFIGDLMGDSIKSEFGILDSYLTLVEGCHAVQVVDNDIVLLPKHSGLFLSKGNVIKKLYFD